MSTYAYCKTKPVEKPNYLAIVGKLASTALMAMLFLSYAPSAFASEFAQDMGRTTKEFFIGVTPEKPKLSVEVRNEPPDNEAIASANLANYNGDRTAPHKKRIYVR